MGGLTQTYERSFEDRVSVVYKDLRAAPSSPMHWATSLGSSGRLRLFVSAARLHFGLDRRWRRIARLLPRGSGVLDAGCGQGTWVRFLESKEYRPVGLDYSLPLLRTAHRQGGECIVLGSILALPLKEGSFDGLLSWGVIEHDEAGPQEALSQFRKVLKPGGWLFITVPCDSSQVRRAFAIERANEVTEPDDRPLVFYQYLFTKAELAGLLRSSGFEVHRLEKASRHPAVAFPRLFSGIRWLPPTLRDVLSRILLPFTFFRPHSTLMLFAAAKRSAS